MDYTPLWMKISSMGISKRKLSEMTGLSSASVSYLGRKAVRSGTIDRICRALGCGVEDVVRWVPDGTVVKPVDTRPARSDSGKKDGASENLEKETFSREQSSKPEAKASKKASAKAPPEKYTYAQKEAAYSALGDKSFVPMNAYITEHDVSYTALRNGTGIDVGTLVSFSSGSKVPSYDEAGRIVRFLGCRLSDVCSYTEAER